MESREASFTKEKVPACLSGVQFCVSCNGNMKNVSLGDFIVAHILGFTYSEMSVMLSDWIKL